MHAKESLLESRKESNQAKIVVDDQSMVLDSFIDENQVCRKLHYSTSGQRVDFKAPAHGLQFEPKKTTGWACTAENRADRRGVV